MPNARGLTLISPLLFILFLNDITYRGELYSMKENDLIMLSVYLILFAYDIVPSVSLQAQIKSK
jgi:hypothetical protein